MCACVCLCLYVCVHTGVHPEPMDGYPSTRIKCFPWANSPVLWEFCRCFECQLASVYYSCAVYREAQPATSNNSLQMGQGNENKACAAETFRVWGFVGNLCPSSSLGATLKLLLVWLGQDFTWCSPVRLRPGGLNWKQVCCFFFFSLTRRACLLLVSEAFLFCRSLFV